MEKERQDSAELQLARPWVNLEYLSENTNFYGIIYILFYMWGLFISDELIKKTFELIITPLELIKNPVELIKKPWINKKTLN